MKSIKTRQATLIPAWGVAIITLFVLFSPSLLFFKRPRFFLALHFIQIAIAICIYLLTEYYSLLFVIWLYGIYMLIAHALSMLLQHIHSKPLSAW